MNSFLNDELLKKSIDKINIHRTDEGNRLYKIYVSLTNNTNFYNSDNARLMKNLNESILKKMNTLKNIHSNNSYVLNRNIKKYQEVKVKVESEFKQIKTR